MLTLAWVPTRWSAAICTRRARYLLMTSLLTPRSSHFYAPELKLSVSAQRVNHCRTSAARCHTAVSRSGTRNVMPCQFTCSAHCNTATSLIFCQSHLLNFRNYSDHTTVSYSQYRNTSSYYQIHQRHFSVATNCISLALQPGSRSFSSCGLSLSPASSSSGLSIFDRHAKLLQRERAAARPDAPVYDYLKDEVRCISSSCLF